ncbi:MAG: YitT family protein, partial [Spirochaetaceae bacterium]
GVSIGNGYLIIETVIIVCVGLIFADLDIVIWSYFGLFLSSKFVDLVTEGISRVKSATIVCSSPEAEQRIRDRIYEQLDRGCTFLKGQGTWSGTDKKIIFVAFNLQQVATLTALVREEDPEVFMIMNDVHDAIGFGFKSRQMDFGE